MPITMTYFDDVNDWLSVGADLDIAVGLTGQDYDDVISDLFVHGVTHVLDLRAEWEDRWWWESMGLPTENYCHAPIIDSRRHTPPERWFQSIEDFVKEFWSKSYDGDRLYVHCQMGINRGPTAAMLSLLTVDPEMHPWQAFTMIREARPCAGIVYSEHVGARHVQRYPSDNYTETPASFVERVRTYWTDEMIATARAARRTRLTSLSSS